MLYASINANALSRFLFDPSSLRTLSKQMTLVVCQLDSATNGCQPLNNVRHPPKVPQNPGVVTSQDWSGARYPEIGTGNTYDVSDIDKHVGPGRKASIERIAAQHPYLSAFKAEEVDKWVTRDTTTKNAQEEDTTKAISDTKASSSTISGYSLQHQENIHPRRKPGGIKTRLAILPGGEVINPRLSSNISSASKPFDKSFGRSLWAPEFFIPPPVRDLRLVNSPDDHTLSRVRRNSMVGSGEVAASSSSSKIPGTPIVPDGVHVSPIPTLATQKPHSTTEQVDLLLDIDSDVLPNSLNMEEGEKGSNPVGFDPNKSPLKPGSDSVLFSEHKVTSNPMPDQLLDFVFPPKSPTDEHSEIGNKRYHFDEMLALRPDIPEDIKANSQEHNSQQRKSMFWHTESRDRYWQRSAASHGRTPSDGVGCTSSGTSGGAHGKSFTSAEHARPSSTVSGQRLPNWKSIHLKALKDRSNSPSFRQTPVLDKLDDSSLTSRAGESMGEQQRPRPSLNAQQMELLERLVDIANKEDIREFPSIVDTPHDPPYQPHVGGFVTPPCPALHADLIELSPEVPVPDPRGYSPHLNQTSVNQADQPVACEQLAAADEPNTREFRRTMFHQQPVGSSDRNRGGGGKENDSDENARPTNCKNASGHSTAAQVNVELKGMPGLGIAAPPASKQALMDSTRVLFQSLGPLLNAVRGFPGPLTFEIQLGLMFILNLTASNQGKELSFKEVQDLFFSQHNLTPPRTSFSDRLTASPSDIDYLIGLKVDQRSLFEQNVFHRGIKYNFHCRTSSNTRFIISLGHQGTPEFRYPRVQLGSVSMSFPAQVWDASAVVQGFPRFYPDAEDGLEDAIGEMIKSLWIDPKSKHIQMLLRLPPQTIMKIDAVFVDRRTSHRWISDQSEKIFLKVTETQALDMIPSVLDSDFLVVKSAPHEEMVKQGKYWWQASITSPAIEEVLKQNFQAKNDIKPGTPSDSWKVADLFGADYKLIAPTADLSAVGAKISHSGIGAMFRLAKVIVPNIDAIGFFNKGPAAYVKRNTEVDSTVASGEARSCTVAQGQDLKNNVLVKWNPTPEVQRRKHKW